MVLPYIDLNPPRVYMCPHPEPPSQLPPHPIPLGHPSAPAPSTLSHALNLDWRFCFTYGNVRVSVSFSHIIPPSPSPAESKRLFNTSVSLLLSRIQGYRYHLSKFHMYALLLLSHFSCVQLCATPLTAAHQDTVLVFFFLAYFTLYRLQFHPPH